MALLRGISMAVGQTKSLFSRQDWKNFATLLHAYFKNLKNISNNHFKATLTK